jgi:hypothetical protein
MLNQERNSWSELPPLGDPDAYTWAYAAIDPQSKRMLVPQGYAENEQLVMKMLIGVIDEQNGLRSTTWVTDKKTVLGETSPNVRLNSPPARNDQPNRDPVGFGPGIHQGADMYVPYTFSANTYKPPNIYADGPHSSGVIASDDAGRTWRLERISDRGDTGAPALCQTTGYLYYVGGALWFSRKPRLGGKWEEPQAITKTFAIVLGRFAVAGEGDTAHICWMDRRHDKWRFNFDSPPVENNDIYYRYRKDADSDWSKEVLLSRGLLYCYAPTISAEGNNVVVAWAGIRDAGKWHGDMGTNDIYYVTSKDAGKTWSGPLKVTDGAKDGLTAGMPQVALLNGTVHLLYTQGKRVESKELSPGLTKLGGEPWPIFYTHRPFPN